MYVITGGAGFIGSNVAHILEAREDVDHLQVGDGHPGDRVRLM